jgi:hypothetical protein
MLNFIFGIENFVLDGGLLVNCSRSCYKFGRWLGEDFSFCGGFVIGMLKSNRGNILIDFFLTERPCFLNNIELIKTDIISCFLFFDFRKIQLFLFSFKGYFFKRSNFQFMFVERFLLVCFLIVDINRMTRLTVLLAVLPKAS